MLNTFKLFSFSTLNLSLPMRSHRDGLDRVWKMTPTERCVSIDRYLHASAIDQQYELAKQFYIHSVTQVCMSVSLHSSFSALLFVR